MFGQDTEIIGDIEGLIQSRIGSFLQAKSKLQEMSRSPILTISDSAKRLLTTQTSLEQDLPRAVSGAQSGEISELIFSGAFYVQMDKQISDVDGLYGEYTGLGPSAQATLVPGGISKWLLYGVAGFLGWKLLKKKKR